MLKTQKGSLNLRNSSRVNFIIAIFFGLLVAFVGYRWITSQAAQDYNADLNGDNTVNILDLSILLSKWGQTGSQPADINADGIVSIIDLSILLSKWGNVTESMPLPATDVTIEPAPGGLASAVTQAVNANKQGKSVKIVLQPNAKYRETLQFGPWAGRTSAHIYIEGQGATISGADVYNSWTSNPDGTLWTTWTHNLGNASDYWPYLDYNRTLLNREALYVGESPYYVVDNLSDLVPGTFHVNETTDKITVKPKPDHAAFSGAEVTVRLKTIWLEGQQNVTVRNITLERGAGTIQESMSGSSNSSNITWENVTFRQAAGGGSSACCGNNVTYKNVKFFDNGTSAWGTYKMDGVTVTNLEMARTNWRGTAVGFNGWTVGTKIGLSKNVNIDGWNSHHNFSHGFWTDWDNRNINVKNLTSAGNLGRGMFIESNPGPITVENALVCNNGGTGITYARSDYVTVKNSKVFLNAGWQHIQQGNPTPPVMSDGTTLYGHHLRLENTVTVGDDWAVKDSLNKGWLFWQQRDDPTFWSTSSFANNTWFHTQRTNAWSVDPVWNVWKDYAGWVAKSGETGGSWTNPGTLECPANRPPASYSFDVGW